MQAPPIVTPEEWEAARTELLVKEKEVTRARDALAAQRRRMPWTPVEKEYTFEVRRAGRACSTCSRTAASCSSTGRSSSPACTAGPSTPARVAR